VERSGTLGIWSQIAIRSEGAVQVPGQEAGAPDMITPSTSPKLIASTQTTRELSEWPTTMTFPNWMPVMEPLRSPDTS
jgi:hypothetical protein